MLSNSEYEKIKVEEVSGRYVTNETVFELLSGLEASYKVETFGASVLGKPIKNIEFGTGPQRILIWSQMHGNESTTTKAVLDFINYLEGGGNRAEQVLKKCTLKIIPILSPDGAEAYTRVNANNIDLNRDAQNLSQPESIALREVFDSFQPNFCYNLHDQRTIYSVGDSAKPASVSFLSPSVDETRTINGSRKSAMQVIVGMNKMLQAIVPGQVGRYDDGYNLNCVGDTFQTLGCPTVLFEAGHYQNDYQRETTRKLIFQSLITATTNIGTQRFSDINTEEYFKIPENEKQFFDVLVKNIDRYDSRYKEGDSVGILFKEVLKSKEIVFVPKIDKVGALNSYFGHQMYDCTVEKDLAALKGKTQLCSVINNI